MLWIALYLPELSLQIVERGTETEYPLAISGGPSNRPVVFAVNQPARDLGVKPGMPLAAAKALAGELQAQARAPDKEAEALHNLACWALQFTPSVSLQAQQGLLMEVSATLMLHRGLSNLLALLRTGMNELGYRASAGVAPTPMAAWMFARARYHGYAIRTCTEPGTLDERLGDLPLPLFDWPPDMVQTLSTLGILRVADCLKLPRDGFTLRFGAQMLLDLDRARGKAPDPRPWFVPPERFSGAVDFGFEVHDALALQFPLKRLLLEMEGFLRARGVGVQQWHVLMQHSKTQTRLTLGVTAPERNALRLLALARERLTQLKLPESVIGMRIQADQFFSLEEKSASWLPDPREQSTGWLHLIDKLSARLGEEKIYRLESRDDHRPERAWQKAPAGIAKKAIKKNTVKSKSPVKLTSQPRPLMLLPVPRTLLTDHQQPLCQGRLELLAGPERIESGWWDGRPASRDYYVARNPHGETLWIYHEHRHADTWYLHGFFA